MKQSLIPPLAFFCLYEPYTLELLREKVSFKGLTNMHSESVKSSQSPPAEAEKHKNLDREIREMVSAITGRVTNFHKPGSTHHLDNEDENGTRIITLAGTNEGATLRSEMDEKSGHQQFNHAWR
ncbi:hypothetical protein KIW84_015236 [Lathyrus oleraceus]|uniref:Uncharacterized protein n=2 Tax=Pisum sativum TaxID=3888 RepID=A0A9D5BQ89_PEA|nr:hypothetical protein KIW84_015236 [Pisum sativum]